ncbi:MAG: hypothetical protein MUE36_03380 [Acidimicrobiales bacterium]|nr:hypothetical protein [Acidimicrobiales bacterium]
MGLSDAHSLLAWVLIVTNAVAGVWVLGANWWAALRSRVMWWSVAVAMAVVVAQVALGVAVQEIDDIESPPLHALYGFTALIAVGVIYSYAKQMRDRQYVVYGFGLLFIMGLGIRELFLA